jgi:hypothetical protein
MRKLFYIKENSEHLKFFFFQSFPQHIHHRHPSHRSIQAIQAIVVRGVTLEFISQFQMHNTWAKVCIPLAALIYMSYLAIYTNSKNYVSQELRADQTV